MRGHYDRASYRQDMLDSGRLSEAEKIRARARLDRWRKALAAYYALPWWKRLFTRKPYC